jgi:hypothetical protein
MSRSLGDNLYLGTPGSSTKTESVYRRVLAEAVGANETKRKVYEEWFRDTIFANPALVIDPCRQRGLTDETWYPWKVEHPVVDGNGNLVGKIDVLLISSSARIGIVETKLAYNPEKRRGVLAQILDYAVHLPELPETQMPPLPQGAGVSREDMAEHLLRGDFLLIIAGDELDPRVVKLSRAIIGDHMLNQWELALVDLALYERTAGAGPGWLIVPNIRGELRTEFRNAVKVDVPEEGGPPRVKIERIPPASSTGRQQWTEDRFLAELRNADRLAPSVKSLAERICALSKAQPERLSLSYGTGNTGSMTLKRDGYGVVEIYLDGTLRFRPDKFQLAWGDQAAVEYLTDLRRLFPEPMQMTYPTVQPAAAAKAADGLGAVIEKYANQ